MIGLVAVLCHPVILLGVWVDTYGDGLGGQSLSVWPQAQAEYKPGKGVASSQRSRPNSATAHLYCQGHLAQPGSMYCSQDEV